METMLLRRIAIAFVAFAITGSPASAAAVEDVVGELRATAAKTNGLLNVTGQSMFFEAEGDAINQSRSANLSMRGDYVEVLHYSAAEPISTMGATFTVTYSMSDTGTVRNWYGNGTTRTSEYYLAIMPRVEQEHAAAPDIQITTTCANTTPADHEERAPVPYVFSWPHQRQFEPVTIHEGTFVKTCGDTTTLRVQGNFRAYFWDWDLRGRGEAVGVATEWRSGRDRIAGVDDPMTNQPITQASTAGMTEVLVRSGELVVELAGGGANELFSASLAGGIGGRTSLVETNGRILAAEEDVAVGGTALANGNYTVHMDWNNAGLLAITLRAPRMDLNVNDKRIVADASQIRTEDAPHVDDIIGQAPVAGEGLTAVGRPADGLSAWSVVAIVAGGLLALAVVVAILLVCVWRWVGRGSGDECIGRAQTAESSERWRKARYWAWRARLANYDVGQAWAITARAHVAVGHTRAALRAFNKANEGLDESNEIAENAFQAAQAAAYNRMPRIAAQWLMAAVALEPSYAEKAREDSDFDRVWSDPAFRTWVDSQKHSRVAWNSR